MSAEFDTQPKTPKQLSEMFHSLFVGEAANLVQYVAALRTEDGNVYQLTQHARSRYVERIGMADDLTILRDCIDNPHAVWAENDPGVHTLVTILDSSAGYAR